MKITDGLWLSRAGATLRPSVEVNDVAIDEAKGEIKLIVACKHIESRGDTLGGPVLTVKLSSPMDDVVKVNVTHFAGIKHLGPDFDLFPNDTAPASPPKSTISQTDAAVSLTTGGLKVEVDKAAYGFKMDFVGKGTDGKEKVFSSSGYKNLKSVTLPPSLTSSLASESSVLATTPYTPPASSLPSSTNFMQSELSLVVGELIFGLGELFGPLAKNGQSLESWNQDGGTSSEQGYKTVPFYLSNRGYGVFINDPGEVAFEVGSEKGAKVGVVTRGETLEYFFMRGPSMKEVLTKYTALTGRPGLPPAWSFGLWLSTSFTTSYSQDTVTGFLEGMKERNCPVRVMHFDCFWMKKMEWCNFTFDPEHFPDPKAYLAKIKKDHGVKVCLWINSYISQQSPLFEEGIKGDFLIKRKNGDIWQWDLWQPGLAVVDFTNPKACEWYISKLEALLDLGVDSFKTDFGERIPHLDVQYHNGEDPYRVHNFYSYIYNKLVFDLLKRRLGEHEACLFARSATAGGQQFPVHWGGDCESTYEAMSESLRGGLSLTMSGFGFWSHDIGGFEGTPPAALFMRWLAFGAFSSHTRLHGSNSYRVPWVYGEESAQVLSKFLNAKHRLMPYIFAAAIKASETGIPVQRAMVLEFEDDLTCHHLDRQYMFGESLLVAPVFHESEVSFYIPEGVWTSFWDPSLKITGPKWVHDDNVPFDTIPIFVRPSTVLPLGPADSTTPDYEYTSGLELRAYELGEGETKEISIPACKGKEIAALLKVSQQRGKKELKVEVAEGKLAGAWNGFVY